MHQRKNTAITKASPAKAPTKRHFHHTAGRLSITSSLLFREASRESLVPGLEHLAEDIPTVRNQAGRAVLMEESVVSIHVHPAGEDRPGVRREGLA